MAIGGGLPPLTMEFDVDDKGQLKLRKIDGALKNLGSQLDKTSKNATLFSQRMAKVGNAARNIKSSILNLKVAMAGLGGAFVLKNLVSELSSFQTAVADMGRVTDEAFGDIRRNILGLGSELGAPTELVQGYYQAISAGATKGTEALNLLSTASRASQAAHIDQGTTIKAVTKLMTGFAGEIESASDATDLLFTIEKKGQTSFAELAPIIGDVAANSALLNVSAEELGGSLAVISQTAGTTAEASTQYKSVLTAMKKPTTEMMEALKELGYANAESAIETLGFIGTLKGIVDQTDRSSVALGKLFSRVEAGNAIAALMRNNWEDAADSIKEMEKRAGITEKTFADFQDTLEGQWGAILNEITKVKVEFALLADTPLKELLDEVHEVVKEVGEWVKLNKELITANISAFIKTLTTSIKFLVNNFSDLLRIAKAYIALRLAVHFGSLAVSIGSATAAVIAFAGPWGLVATAIGAVVSTMVYFKTDLLEIIGIMDDTSKTFQKVQENLSEGFMNLESERRLKDQIKTVSDLKKQIEDLGTIIGKESTIQEIMGGDTQLTGVVAQRMDSGLSAADDMEKIRAQNKLKTLKEQLILETEKFNKMEEQLYAGKQINEVQKETKQLAALTKNEIKSHLSLYTDMVPFVNAVETSIEKISTSASATNISLEDTESIMQNIADEMQVGLDLLSQQKQEAAMLADNLKFAFDPLFTHNEDLKQLESVKDLISPEVFERAFEDIKNTYSESMNEMKLKTNSFVDGAEVAFDRLSDSVLTMAEFTNTSFGFMFDSLSNQLNRFIQTGKFSFKDFASSILSEMSRLVSSQLVGKMAGMLSGAGGGSKGGGAVGGLLSGVVSIIGGLFGGGGSADASALGSYDFAGATGGIFPTSTNVSAARGGVFSSPTLLVGDQNKRFRGEAVVPLPNGRSIPIEGSTGDKIINIESTTIIQTNDVNAFEQNSSLINSRMSKNMFLTMQRGD